MDEDKWFMIFGCVAVMSVMLSMGVASFSKTKIAKASAICLSYEENDWDSEKNVCVRKK